MVIHPWPGLSARESEVAARICEGGSRLGIASALGVSAKTYDTHRRNVLQRFEVRNEVQLLLKALALGLVAPPTGADGRNTNTTNNTNTGDLQ